MSRPTRPSRPSGPVRVPAFRRCGACGREVATVMREVATVTRGARTELTVEHEDLQGRRCRGWHWPAVAA